MRAAYLFAIAMCVGIMVGQFAESTDVSDAMSDFQETFDEVAPFDDVDEALFEEDSSPVVAKAFTGSNYQGEARDVGTPMVVHGHNNIASLKVPAGQCVALFSLEGYNDGHAGEMLSIRGPMNVPDLDSIKLRKDQTTSWLEATASYKMGPCTAEPTEDMATSAIKSAAQNVPDLQSLSNVAKHAAQGNFGSIVQSFTKSDKADGISRSYDQVIMHDAQFLGGGVEDAAKTDDDTSTVVAGAGAVTPYPYADHKVVEDMDKIEGDPETNPALGGTPSGSGSGSGAGPRPKGEDGLFKWEHARLGKAAWKKFHIPFPKLPSPHPFKDDNSPIDDADDLAKEGKKDEMGCDPMLGCRNPPGPCVDTDSIDICQDYVTNGDCQYDFVQKDCRKSCGLCPKPEGAISSDAYVGPAGHYYLGSARRRVGAGFGRRRRSPAAPKKEKKKTITSPKDPTKKVVKVPVGILHPDGKKTVEVPDPDAKNGVDCDTCVKDFDAAGGCKVWHSGGDASNLVKESCMVCASAAAKHCGVSTTDIPEGDKTLPEPIEHPKTASKIMIKAATTASHDVAKETLPKEVKKAMDKTLKEAGATPETPTVVKGITGAGAVAPVEVPTKADAVVTKAAATKADAEAATTGAAATVVATTAATADKVAEKAESAVVTAEAAAGVSPDAPVVKAAEAKAAVAQTAAKTEDAKATAAQATANTAAAAAETADLKAEAVATKTVMKPISALPPTNAEVESHEASTWAEDQIKAAEKDEKTVA